MNKKRVKTWRFRFRKLENGPFLTKNGPKLLLLAQNAQKWGFLAFFSKTAHWNFLIFCRKPSLCSSKILRLRFFGEIWKMDLFGQYWPKFGLSLANLAGCWNSWKSRKNLKFGGFETAFKQVSIRISANNLYIFWKLGTSRKFFWPGRAKNDPKT